MIGEGDRIRTGEMQDRRFVVIVVMKSKTQQSNTEINSAVCYKK